MNKLEKTHNDVIIYEEPFIGFYHEHQLDVKSIAKQSAEITSDVAIKFNEWCNKPSLEDLRQSNVVYIPSSDFYWYKHKKYTPKELFEKFINNHYEK